MDSIEFFRFLPVFCLVVVAANAAPQQRFALPSNLVNPFGFNQQQQNQLALVAQAVPVAFAASNVIQGDDQIQLRPQLGLTTDGNGNLRPTGNLNVQVGNRGPINPSFNLGAQFNQNAQGPAGLPLEFVGGSGFNLNDGQGGFGGNVGTGFAFTQNGPQAVAQGGATIGAFNVGNVGGLLGGFRG